MSEDKIEGGADTCKVQLAANIVSAYVGHNPVQSGELPELIKMVYQTLESLNQPRDDTEDQKPAVSVKKSVTDEYLICLEDGKKFKSLKRHLRSKYDLSPEEYREKWNLPYDYPMVAPSYARQRSKLAKKMGLGQSKS
ncbi:MAG: MucR family transcriptional regulator [Pseudomonadota bacterium]